MSQIYASSKIYSKVLHIYLQKAYVKIVHLMCFTPITTIMKGQPYTEFRVTPKYMGHNREQNACTHIATK